MQAVINFVITVKPFNSQQQPALLISGQKNQVPIGASNQAPSEL